MPSRGDTLRFSSDLYDEPGGSLTNATTVALTITLPDGTSVTPTVTNPPDTTGLYVYDYATTASSPLGRYVGSWLFTFAGGATTAYEETFDVSVSLVTTDEALQHLRAQGIVTSESDLESLQFYCFAATDAVERDLGRALVPQTIVETHDGGGSVVLNRTPVLSVTTVVESGSTVTDFVINQSAGIMYRGSADSARRFGCGFQNVVVTYRAGYLNPPVVARKVALNLIQGMWQTAQQAQHPALTEYNDLDTPTAVAMLTPLERSAYDSLRAAAIA